MAQATLHQMFSKLQAQLDFDTVRVLDMLDMLDLNTCVSGAVPSRHLPAKS